MGIGDSIIFFGESLEQRGSEFASSVANNAVNQAKNIVQNVISPSIDQGLSYVPGPLRGLAGSLGNDMLGFLPGGCAGGSMYSQPEDFNTLRIINKKLVSAEFVQEWNFRLEIENQPPDFELYIKDISYGGFEIGNDEEHYGAATCAWPNVSQPTRVSFTARDNYDLRIAHFLHDWKKMVLPGNGTVGLPFGVNGYVRKIGICHIKSSGMEIPLYDYLGYPLQYGDATRSHENGQFMEVPVTMVLFSTLY